MRLNKAKQKMLEGKAAVGMSAGVGSPLSAELLALAGFDFVIVDDQHGLWNPSDMVAAFRAIWAAGATPMARVLQNTFGHIGAMVDRGALGIIVPMVNSAEEARAAAHAVRYPPRGGRSAGPYGCAVYGSDYIAESSEEIFLAVQIESIKAVEQAEAILSVDGVDGCWIGPGDLAYSMGIDLSKPDRQEEHLAAIMKVLDACRKTGKIPGLWCVGWAGDWIERGFRFVTPGGETSLIRDGATAIVRRLQEEGHM